LSRPLRRRWWIAGALAAFGVAAGTVAVAKVERYPAGPTAVTVRAAPITAFDTREPSRTRFGALEFRGGLELTSKNQSFGGVSALHMAADGSHFLALTDRGAWLRGRIVYRQGRPAGLADAEMAPVLGRDGRALAAHGWFDTESLAEDGEGHAYVGIERVEKIVRFDLKDGLRARGEPIPVPPDFKTFSYNKSLECVAVAPKNSKLAGGLIAVTEHSLDAAGNHRAFVLRGDHVERFSVKRSDDFDVSDCAILPPNDLLLLERSYSIARGVAMRIRRIPLDSIKAGATVDGTPLINADLAYQIDNMEGLGVSHDAKGETILTLVSDDNFSPLQRTLLLQFRLVP
jgi:hypothetical protein